MQVLLELSLGGDGICIITIVVNHRNQRNRVQVSLHKEGKFEKHKCNYKNNKHRLKDSEIWELISAPMSRTPSSSWNHIIVRFLL